MSGGEAQRLKLASELDRDQANALFVLDEPGGGPHPLDVRTLLSVIGHLTDRGATAVVIEHDLDWQPHGPVPRQTPHRLTDKCPISWAHACSP